MAFYGPYGMGVATDREEYSEYFVKALNDAFTERQLALDVFVCEGAYCGAHGYLVANFTGIFLGNDFHYLKKCRQSFISFYLQEKNRPILTLSLDLAFIGMLTPKITKSLKVGDSLIYRHFSYKLILIYLLVQISANHEGN